MLLRQLFDFYVIVIVCQPNSCHFIELLTIFIDLFSKKPSGHSQKKLRKLFLFMNLRQLSKP